jgi:hypothetical protein
MREPSREKAVAPESEKDSRRAEDVTSGPAEGGNGQAHQHQGAARIAEKSRGRFSQGSFAIISQFIAEDAEGNKLDHYVKESRDR